MCFGFRKRLFRADGVKIKELTDKLASLPPAGTDPDTDKAIEDVKAQLNGIADGLPAKAAAVSATVDSISQGAAAVSAAA